MTDGEVKNAIIKSVTIGDDDHGNLTAWLRLDYGGSQQGFGGYQLLAPKHASKRPDYAGHFIWRCMEIGGVRSWEHLTGKTIRVRVWDGLAIAIGHIINDDWFDPRRDFDAMSVKESSYDG